MLGKRSLQPGCCPCGSRLRAGDKRTSGLGCHMQMAARCLSKTSVTFSAGTCHCFEQHSSHRWLLSAAARCTLLIYFPSPPSVYPAGCCSEAARRCYNCWWVNIYRVQWGWRSHWRRWQPFQRAMTSWRAGAIEQTFVPTQVRHSPDSFTKEAAQTEWLKRDQVQTSALRNQIDGLLTLLRVMVSDSWPFEQYCVYLASWQAQVLAGRTFQLYFTVIWEVSS